MSDVRRRAAWGWGFADEALTTEQIRALAPGLPQLLGFEGRDPVDPVPPEDVALDPPRLPLPAGDRLARVCSTGTADRVAHAGGQAYPDLVRALHGEFPYAPDVVARPADETDLAELLAWAGDVGAAVVPYGGGTSVVGGVRPVVPDGYAGVVTVDLTGMDRVLEVDPVSRAARIQAGATGPVLERQLAEHGLTLRFFPQSFELSTLGGWVATRAGGHFATGPTHIDDLVESVRALTPVGVWESRRLPGSGAGPSPDRLLLGSEGALGVVTEAWVRVRPRPGARAGRSVRFATWPAAVDAVRAIAQSGLQPANCRLLDPLEAVQSGAGDGRDAVLVLGFEAPERPVDAELRQALDLCASYGGRWSDDAKPSGDGGADAAGTWRDAFLRMPYLRDGLIRLGVLADTFETAVTWDAFPDLHERVTSAVRDALGAPCRVSVRFTHVYPDGPAPYVTVLAPTVPGEEIARWSAMKTAAGNAIAAAGGTITHHHAVGRDHRRWYDSQRPDPFAAALRAAKGAVDPGALLNPGVLVDP